ncbi:MAG TPA: hypothetical protein VLE49_02485, partial [Anaerolineales bacterium]|nr:hypothetical protein [Anaerolineales bacterium]
RELVRDLIQDGVIREQDDGWQLVSLPEELSLPESLGHLISQRLLSLSPPARSLVEVTAVAGPVFDLELVSEVGAWQEAQVLDNLDELLDKQIVQETVGGGHFDFTFTHDLIRRVIYEATPEDVRRRRHRRIGHVMESLRANELDTLAGELALHFELGGETERAALYYERMAQHSWALYADEEALTASQHALSLSADHRHRFDLLALREEIFHRRGERSVQQETLEQLMVQAQSLNDDELVCEVLRRRIRYHSELGEREAQENLIAELKAHAVALQKPRWMLESLLAESSYQALRADYEQAGLLAERALHLAQQISDYSGQISAYLILIDIATQRWDFPALQANLAPLTALVEEHSDQGTLVKSLRAAASAAFSRQDFDVSQRLSQQMLDLCQRIGDREGEADAHSRLAMIAARLFRVSEARYHYAQAATLYQQVRKRQGQASVLLNNGLFLARLGRYAESQQTFVQAAALFGEMGDMRGQAICALNQCAVAIYQGDLVEAETQARLCQKVSHEVGLSAVEALSLGNLGEIALRQGQSLQAVHHLRKAIASRRKLGIPETVSVMDLSALLEAYLTTGNLRRARQTAEELLTLYRADPQSMEYPQYVLWALSLFHQAKNDAEKADDYLTQAYDLLQQRAAAIPDEESRTSFLKMPYNRRVLDACERSIRPKPDG